MAPPILDGGLAFCVSRPQGVVALDVASTQVVWKMKTQTAWGACQLHAESLLVVPFPGVLRVVDPATGVERETHSVGELTLEYSAIAGGRIVTPLVPVMLGAWDLSAHQWSWRRPSAWNLSLLAASGEIVCVAEEHAYVGLDLESGGQRWRFDVTELGRHASLAFGEGPGAAIGRPIVADDTIYVGVTGGWLVALDAATGEQKWRTQVGERSPRNFDLTPQQELFVLSDDSLTVVTAGSGETRSLRRIDNQERLNGDGPFAPMTITKNFIWTVDALGRVIAIEPREAKIVFRYPLHRRAAYPLVIGRDRLFALDLEGKLTILSTPKPREAPTTRHAS